MTAILNILLNIVNVIISFVTGILDQIIFDFLPDVSLALGYVQAFFELIFNHMSWIIDATGINYSNFGIIFGFYILRYALIEFYIIWDIVRHWFNLGKDS